MSDIAYEFVSARRNARALAAFPGDVPADLATAYAVQDAALQLSAARPLAGWKVARIQPVFHDRYPDERLVGPVFADAALQAADGDVVRVHVYEGGFAAIEAEFVVRLGRDLLPTGEPFTMEEVAAAAASLHVGSEIASSPLLTINELGPGSVISDHGNNAGAIVGPAIENGLERDPSTLISRAYVDGVLVGEGTAGNVPGGPLAAVRFLADNLARRGRTLRAGDIVLTGMTTGIHVVAPGSRGRLEFPGVGAFEIDVAAAAPRD